MGQAALTLVAALLLAPRQPESGAAAAAPPQPEMSVSFRDCEANPVGKSVFLGALALELFDLRSAEPYEPVSVTEIAVALACDGTAQIRIRAGASALERAVRFDDVPPAQRARALALVVAELVRSAARESDPGAGAASRAAGVDAASPGGKPSAAASASAPAASAKPPSAKPPSAPAEGAAAAGGDTAESDANLRHGQSGGAPRFLVAATLRATLDAQNQLWGGAAGVDLGVLRALAELCLAHSTVERGSITSGVGAVRIGRTFEFARAGSVGLGAGGSVAGGVTWTVGDSVVPGTIVQEVLKPYFDAELELATRFEAAAHFEPELTLYGGRAAGIAATSGDEVQQATGGWFAGVRLGALF